MRARSTLVAFPGFPGDPSLSVAASPDTGSGRTTMLECCDGVTAFGKHGVREGIDTPMRDGNCTSALHASLQSKAAIPGTRDSVTVSGKPSPHSILHRTIPRPSDGSPCYSSVENNPLTPEAPKS